MTTNNPRPLTDEAKVIRAKKQQQAANQSCCQSSSASSTDGWPKDVGWDAIFDEAIRHREAALLKEQLEALKPRGGKFIIKIKETSYVRKETREATAPPLGLFQDGDTIIRLDIMDGIR